MPKERKKGWYVVITHWVADGLKRRPAFEVRRGPFSAAQKREVELHLAAGEDLVYWDGRRWVYRWGYLGD